MATLPHTDQLLTLETSAGEIVTTEDHRYWNGTDQAWQQSRDLDTGDRLLSADGTVVEVEGLDWTTLHNAPAYDLTVADLHTFYVAAGEAAVLVHNCNGWGNPRTLEDHFRRHGADFGSPDADSYARLAQSFYSRRAEYLVKVDDAGVVRVYDKATNTFGSYNPNGTTKTFYKPNPAQHGYPTNWDYWLAQPGR